MKKLGQEPAFACECMSSNGNDGHIQEGMSKRFYAACAAMQGMLANNSLMSNSDFDIPNLITVAYKSADELLTQESHE